MGILAGDGALFVFHPLHDPVQLLPADPLLPPLVKRCLHLVVHDIFPVGKIFPVRHPRHGVAAHGLPANLFQMNHHIGRPLDEGLIMGNVQHRLFGFSDKSFHPQQRWNINIVGRLIQQKHIRLSQKKPCHLRFHLLAAGQSVHLLLSVIKIGRQPQFLRQFAKLLRTPLEKLFFLTEKLIERPLFFLRGQLLRQIADSGAARDALALRFHIIFHQRRIHQPLQERGLSVALFPNDDRLIARVQRKAEILKNRPQIFFMHQMQVLYLYHDNPSSLFSLYSEFPGKKKRLPDTGQPMNAPKET